MFYPTITTIDDLDKKNINSTKQKIAEATKLKITTACFFPTCLDKKCRQLAYKLLEKSSIKNIPLVHLRADMTSDEIAYFQKKFRTKFFNLHGTGKYQPGKQLQKNYRIICLENLESKINKTYLKKFAGLCVDFTHLESSRLEPKFKASYQQIIKLLKKDGCSCGHVSAISSYRHADPYDNLPRFDHHAFAGLKEFDYLTRYQKFLPNIIALEMECSLVDQLRTINYINKKLKI